MSSDLWLITFLLLQQGQSGHRTKVLDKSDKQKNILKSDKQKNILKFRQTENYIENQTNNFAL